MVFCLIYCSSGLPLKSKDANSLKERRELTWQVSEIYIAVQHEPHRFQTEASRFWRRWHVKIGVIIKKDLRFERKNIEMWNIVESRTEPQPSCDGVLLMTATHGETWDAKGKKEEALQTPVTSPVRCIRAPRIDRGRSTTGKPSRASNRRDLSEINSLLPLYFSDKRWLL